MPRNHQRRFGSRSRSALAPRWRPAPPDQARLGPSWRQDHLEGTGCEPDLGACSAPTSTTCFLAPEENTSGWEGSALRPLDPASPPIPSLSGTRSFAKSLPKTGAVGATGFEHVTPSVSKPREPLCSEPSPRSRLTVDAEGNAFCQTVKRSLSLLLTARHARSTTPGTPTNRRIICSRRIRSCSAGG
jgi:hypothetical protein